MIKIDTLCSAQAREARELMGKHLPVMASAIETRGDKSSWIGFDAIGNRVTWQVEPAFEFDALSAGAVVGVTPDATGVADDQIKYSAGGPKLDPVLPLVEIAP